ncbi:MAG TPA: potassium-transporting ATPase subunit C [Actinobacteria bacterium]|nr:potassium-transporting ATPase subunit C [Actinomycetota bacterium]
MRRQLLPAIRMLLLMTVLTGVMYSLAVTGLAQALWGGRADGSLVVRDGEVVGSELIGQGFTAPEYFHGRPSAVGYDSAASGGSNLGPTNPDLIAIVAERVATYRAENGLASDGAVPVDAVTASSSGLDPHISVRNARLQAPRVAAVRRLPLAEVLALIDRQTTAADLGFLSEPVVNVLMLNLALDAA